MKKSSLVEYLLVAVVCLLFAIFAASYVGVYLQLSDYDSFALFLVLFFLPFFAITVAQEIYQGATKPSIFSYKGGQALLLHRILDHISQFLFKKTLDKLQGKLFASILMGGIFVLLLIIVIVLAGIIMKLL
ncbi:hypothetical protein KC717_02265 [Candidatus Dojkabacteria bacterium]|uniref:Uncharacterized protein n=1 Tax=Candidatus Dojkabacteria bacterium TaxID=2099670 RepID=A0A955RKH5_9BACT|nr:hypothetical protein [Candidatus Dojkabacteria bacterium]